ncbi:gastric intrinsic factor-like [Mizuhopecten yessoensis]|uniref:Gastric intrinsic factor n=1 Tax=Mizuhopecten yessoensis TaxID=6573 RepID=A0A210QVF6_MIZYE|nr:gastric intrinsic factor-like [Mizuhopecten yessoensis]OWF52714.1 Gastric intrinsic factor [Mizuhopecten yessoensis]
MLLFQCSVVFLIVVYTNCCCGADPNTAAIQVGAKELLNSRKNWSWGSYANAEAILGLMLANDTWYRKDDADSVVSVQAMHIELLAALSRNSMLEDAEWSNGKLAQYVSAIQMTCYDPKDFYGHNLVYILSGHMTQNREYFMRQRFALSWGVLALCNANEHIEETFKKLLGNPSTNFTFGVDEAAMTLMALTCIKDTIGRQSAENFIVRLLRSGVTLGEYSSSLAIQALRAAGTMGVDDLISRITADLRQSLLNKTSSLMTPAGALHILPALAGTSPLDIGRTVCQQETNGMSNVTSSSEVTLKITVDDGRALYTPDSWTITIANGTTLYDAMLVLQQRTSSFRFQATHSSFGYSVESINGVRSDTTKSTYWQILQTGNIPISSSVSGTIPKEGDHFIFRLKTWGH